MTDPDREWSAERVDHDTLAPAVQRHSIRKNVGVTAISQAVGWVIATAVAVVVPRYIGPETEGQVQLAWSLWAIGGVLSSFGSEQYLQLKVAEDPTAGLRLVGPVAVARTTLFTLASIAVSTYLFLTDASGREVGMAAVVGTSILLGLWSGLVSTTFFGLERMTDVAKQTIGFRVLGLAVTLGVIWLDLGVFGVLWSGLAVTALTTVAIARSLRRVTHFDLSWTAAQVKQVVFKSVPFMAVGTALTLYRQIDVVVISRVAGDRDLGWYSAADRLFGSLLFPTTIVLGAVFPALGRLNTHDHEAFRSLVARTLSLLLLVSVPVGLGAGVVGPAFAPILFGDRFEGTGTLLSIFGPVTVLTVGTTFLGTVAMTIGRQRFVATLLFVCAALTVGLDAVLVPWAADRYDNGAIGGALAFVVTETLQFALGLRFLAPYVVTPDWAWRAVRTLLCGGIMMLAIWPLRHSFVLLPIVVGAAVYIVAVVAMRVPDEFQRTLLNDTAARVGLRRR